MYFVLVLNNVKVVVVGEFNMPLSNYCNNLGNEAVEVAEWEHTKTYKLKMLL
jgi:hypothetical protein